MALMDYRKLCPKSGHPLTKQEVEALRASAGGAKADRLRCSACGRIVEACLHPGIGRTLIHAMHLRHDPAPSASAGDGCRSTPS